jgi:hypothetical protein
MTGALSFIKEGKGTNYDTNLTGCKRKQQQQQNTKGMEL